MLTRFSGAALVVLVSAIGGTSIGCAADAINPAASDARLIAPVQSHMELWYDKPAGKWEEALPVGSGRLGAMVFGGTGSERIQFNEDTLWTGRPRSYVRAGAKDHLKEIQQLIFDGKQEEAAELFRATMISDPIRQKAYQPFGDLRFTFPGHDAAGDFRRNLDLNRAVATTTYTVDGVRYTREVFASYPDSVLVVRIRAAQPGRVSFTLRKDSPHESSTTDTRGDDTIVLNGQVKDLVPPHEMGTRFESRVIVKNAGGSKRANEGAIVVENADNADILLVAATSFENWQNADGDPAARNERFVGVISQKPVDRIMADALADHWALFGRVTIDLGTTDLVNIPTDQRVARVRRASGQATTERTPRTPDTPPRGGLPADPHLAALFFQYGRYMLIGASRPGTQAANLQGVWNELLNPPWESKYTTNINFEMNYWPAEVTNLSELHFPMFDMIDDLRVSGAITARDQYGARGWVLHHNTDIWRGTAPINNIDGMWPTGGAWLCWHMWEHYQYTGDKKFLAERAYPAMKEAATFFVDFLIPDPKTGWLVTNPSHSPEQGPLNAGPAMDMQLIRALIDITTESANILGVDQEFVAQLTDIRSRLVPDLVGKHGQLQEWKEDWDAPENQHRHMSPLWGLFPGNQFTPYSDPKIYEAAKTLLRWRGDGSTGWSFAWRIPLWARTGD
ncbi:MAG TPA: glycoside hydrolase family 95 protein, partial [Tepidisphaeraceae bacterium]|nr:glycoside hydrolase family 95 protein [Tepidisphaeraceae bacterium]